jgi:hypothetical protein
MSQWNPMLLIVFAFTHGKWVSWTLNGHHVVHYNLTVETEETSDRFPMNVWTPSQNLEKCMDLV